MTRATILSAKGITLGVTDLAGMISGLRIERHGRTIAPLHWAPWIGGDDEDLASLWPHLAMLEGDFFCAPFGAATDPEIPPHGWTANGVWHEIARRTLDDGSETTFGLDHDVYGASVEKRIGLRDQHPVVYQTHILRGGSARLPIAHHAMIHVPGGAALSFSPKAFGATPALSLDHGNPLGRALLRYPQRFATLDKIALADGGSVDLRCYPFGELHEDFACLFEAPDTKIAWSGVVAEADGFVFFGIKDAAVLGQTNLWMSHGGRDFAPWNRRHRHVLGIEEGCTHFADGMAASAAENDLSRAGYGTAVDLVPEGEITVRYALGAIPVPAGFSRLADIVFGTDEIVLVDVGGAREPIPFDTAFFDRP